MAVVKTGGSSYASHMFNQEFIDVSGQLAKFEPDLGFFATSGIANITSAGSLLFNCEGSHPGALIEGEIVNIGTTGMYVGLNSLTPVAASGYYLEPDASMSFGIVPIRQIWAITAVSGSTFCTAWGNFNRNPNAM